MQGAEFRMSGLGVHVFGYSVQGTLHWDTFAGADYNICVSAHTCLHPARPPLHVQPVSYGFETSAPLSPAP